MTTGDVQPQPKKGMSKGCLIALIVVGVIIVLVAIAAVTCYMKRESLAKWGVTAAANGVKEMLAENPPAGIDTTRFNAVTDAFVEKLKASEGLDAQKLQIFIQEFQNIPQDSKVDSAEAKAIMDAMYDFFPDIQEVVPRGEIPEVPLDSMITEDTVLTD